MVGKIHIMGIVNLTPDSFYAASRTLAQDALSRIEQMQADGADVIDLGACSTRPGSVQPTQEEEWSRLEPVLQALACRDHPALSIDTYRPQLVRRAHEIVGPFLVNDVGGGEPEMLQTVGPLGLPYIAMHGRVFEGDVVTDVLEFFQDFAREAREAGIQEWLLDPGFGFSKNVRENYRLLQELDRITQAFPQETLVGVSRKSMAYKLLGITPEEALPATQVLQFAALERGATWLRVHDVAAAVQTARIFNQMA